MGPILPWHRIHKPIHGKIDFDSGRCTFKMGSDNTNGIHNHTQDHQGAATPNRLVSDNDLQFESKDFAEFMAQNVFMNQYIVQHRMD